LTAWVSAQQPVPRITRIEFSPAKVEEGGGVFVSLIGSGRCSYAIDYGDGTNERRTAELPDRLQHVFAGEGEYTVVVTPDAPCEGVARAKLDVRAISRGVWGLAAEAVPEGPNAGMLVTVSGRGECVVTVDFGDGTVEKISGALPQTRTHRYERMGVYELKAIAEPPCRGEAGLQLEIKK
jgi:plastocyanin